MTFSHRFPGRKKSFSRVPFPSGSAETKISPVLSMLAVFAVGLSAFGQVRAPLRFDQLTTEEGLTQSSIRVIYQDRAGYLWVGTFGGLFRYDGYRFQSYTRDPFEPGSISDNSINTIFEDDQGTLWIGTSHGLNRFNAEDGTFAKFQDDPSDPFSQSPQSITAVMEDRQQTLWVGTGADGLYRLDRASGDFTRLRHNPGSVEHEKILALLLDGSGRLWISAEDEGLCRYDPVTRDFRHFHHDPAKPGETPPSDKVTVLYEDRVGTLWIGTHEDGLAKLDPETGGWYAYRHDPGTPERLNDNPITAIIEDRRGQLWVGTLHSGLYRLDRETGQFTHFTNTAGQPDSLSHYQVYSLLEDRSGILWIGTHIGLNKLVPNRAFFLHVKNEPGNPGSLSNNRIWSIFHDRESGVWIGTEAGLNRWDPESESFRSYRHDPDDNASLSHDIVSSIAEDRRGRLWIGTHEGLNRMDRISGDFVRYDHRPEDPGSLSNNRISSVFVDRDDALWVGSRGGLDRLDEETGTFVHYGPESGLEDHAIWAQCQDREGFLWLGSPRGLYRMDPASGRAFVLRHDSKNPKSLTNDGIGPVFEDRDGVLWVGTFFGLNRLESLDPSTGQAEFRSYTTKDGLAHDLIYGILQDERGFLWISTNDGLSKLDPATGQVRNYDTNDGLQSNEFSSGAASKSENGQMLFGGINGVNAFFPDRIQDNTLPPPLVLTQFQINHHGVRLSEVPTVGGRIKLTHRDYIFSFDFAALDFTAPEKNSYKYFLEGLDPDWSPAQTRHFVSYTNLDPGSYTFRVKAANNSDVWNEPFSVALLVVPPPWKTWWAYTLYLLTGAAILLGYIASQRRKLAHERSVVQRLKEVDKFKDEFLANTSHELRTPLNGIIGIAESLVDGITGRLPKRTTDNLELIVSSGKRLASLVNDILDFSKLSSKKLALTTQPVDLHALTSVVFTLSKPLVGTKDLRLVNDIPRDLPPANADEDRLQQILHNLIGNAIKFTDKGTVTVTAGLEEGMLAVRIADTGIGIPESQFERIFESFEQADGSTARTYGGTGLGLAITKQLVAIHGGEIGVASTPGRGSTFRFTLPVSKQAVSQPQPEADVVSKVQDIETAENVSLPESGTLEVDAIQPDAFHIMIVDDEPVNRQVLANHLTLQHYNICEASSGTEALRYLSEGKPCDLVLLDIMMPRMSGYEVCQKIRQTRSVNELPIIFLTAKNRVSDLVTGFISGGNDYLTKPITKAELLSRVKTHLQLLDINRNLEQKVAARTRELSRKNEMLAARNTELKSKNQELETLDRIVKTINREIKLQRLLQILLDQGLALFPQAEKGMFILWEARKESFRFAAANGYDMNELADIDFTLKELKDQFTEGSDEIEQGIYLARQYQVGGLSARLRRIRAPKSMLSMAVSVDDLPQGLLVLDNLTDPEAFDHSDVRKLDRFREHAVSAVAKARFLTELEEKNREILRTQNQLIMQEKLASLGTLTAGIAHEIKNPLNFVNNFAWLSIEMFGELRKELEAHRDLLGEKAFDELQGFLKDLEQNAEIIVENGKRADHIVHSMMALVQGKTGARQDTDINALVEQYANLAYHGMSGKSPNTVVTIHRDFDETVGRIPAVSQDLGRVLINLVNNGIYSVLKKHQELGGDFQPSIWLVTRNIGDRIEIRIRDNGLGIKREDLDKIFNPFFTTKPTGKGNIGLGLSISYEIVVQEHGGQLSVDSKEGEYTEFVIDLPIADAN